MVFTHFENRHIYNIVDEESLQKACVKYLQETTLTYTSNGLPVFLDTKEKRTDACSSGYRVGSPDLLILTPNSTYNMLAIELKAPTGFGTLTRAQGMMLEELEKDCKACCIVINDFGTFVEIIQKYVNDLL